MTAHNARHIAFIFICVGALAACSKNAAPDAAAPSSSQSSSYSSIFSKLLPFNKPAAEPQPVAGATASPTIPPNREEEIDCPEIAVQDGTSAVRIYNGNEQTNDKVRYQFSLGEMARECRAEGKDLKIKVGVSGLVLMGPAGSAGQFTVPVRVVVRHDADQKPVVSELYRIDAALKGDESQTRFVFVTPILSVPHTRPDEDQVYTIFVGFDPGAKAEKPAKTNSSPKKARSH
jgi:hypothetical protein